MSKKKKLEQMRKKEETKLRKEIKELSAEILRRLASLSK